MSINPEGASEYAGAVGKAAPPIAVSTAAIAGLSLQDWVLAATLAYTLLQIVFLLRKFFKEQERA